MVQWRVADLTDDVRAQALEALDHPDAPKTMSVEVFFDRVIGPQLDALAVDFDGLAMAAPGHPRRKIYHEQLTEENGSITMLVEGRHLDQEIDVLGVRIVWRFEPVNRPGMCD